MVVGLAIGGLWSGGVDGWREDAGVVGDLEGVDEERVVRQARVPFAALPPGIVERFDRIWHEEQRSLAEESTEGSYEVVAGSRHNIQVEQPQAVITAVESVLSAATPG